MSCLKWPTAPSAIVPSGHALGEGCTFSCETAEDNSLDSISEQGAEKYIKERGFCRTGDYFF